jgi:pimeloyl-ACP methyl ester carboxylesterase
MKFRKYFILLLSIVFFLPYSASVEAKSEHQDPDDALIRQVLLATMDELGWNASDISYDVSETGVPNYLTEDYDFVDTAFIGIHVYESANAAKNDYQAKLEDSGGWGEQQFSFHGYPAVLWAVEPGEGYTTMWFQPERFIVYVQAELGEEQARNSLETFYRNAGAFGLIGGNVIEITPTPGDEHVGIQIQAEGFETKDFIFTSVDPISELNIEGYVVDAQGNGIAGATVTLLQSSFVETTRPDGFFNISASVKDQGKPFGVSQNFVLFPLEFTAEILDKDRNGNSYTGVAADGISSLTLQINIPAGLDPNKAVIDCSIDATVKLLQDYSSPCSTPVIQGDKVILQVTPLEKFVEPYSIRVALTYPKNDDSLFFTEISDIKVIHPPVVLIHGIWSSQGSMMPLRSFLKNTGLFPYQVLADYSATSYGEIRNNVAALQSAVNTAFYRLETNGYMGQRVDIVAHSMGGLISRLYMLGYTAPDGSPVTGQAHKVRKLITLSTPHLGSPLGDWYTELDPPGMFDCSGLTFGVSDWKGSHEPYKDEYEYILNKIRSGMGLRSDALTFGEGARQLSTIKNPILDALNAKQRSVGNQQTEFYFLAGAKPFTGKWVGDLAAISAPRLLYMYSPTKVGPCGQTDMPVSFEEMVSEFISFTTMKDSDGVVQVTSSLGNTTGIQPLVAKTVPFNHFSITEAGTVWKDVYTYLVGAPPGMNGSFFYKGSPGILHVYDDQGRHVGPDEIGIPGATYEEFEDVTGGHTLIYIPDDGQFTINVDAAEAGLVTLEVNQGGADGWRWTRYEELQVDSGSQIELNYDRDNPQGQVTLANGEMISLVPTHHELVSTVPMDLTDLTDLTDSTDDNPLAGMGSGLQSLWLVGCVALVGLVLIALIIIWAIRRNSRGTQTNAGSVGGNQYNRVQDSRGRWWYQDQSTGVWHIWNGKAWLPAPPGARPEVSAVKQARRKPIRGGGSCLFTIIASVLIVLVVVGGISLIAFNFFPDLQLEMGPGDVNQILTQGGGGLLLTILGFFLLNGGFKAIITRRAVVEDDWGRRREKRGCGAILNGIGQIFFGFLCQVGGLGLITLAFYQEILPWLGF